MSIDMAAKKAGIELERDVPKQGQRRAKDWARLIGWARKLEAQAQEDAHESSKKIEDLATRVVALTEENAELHRELAAFRLKERMQKMELPEADRLLLLGERKTA